MPGPEPYGTEPAGHCCQPATASPQASDSGGVGVDATPSAYRINQRTVYRCPRLGRVLSRIAEIVSGKPSSPAFLKLG